MACDFPLMNMVGIDRTMLSRRGFLLGSAALAAVAGIGSRSQLAHAQTSPTILFNNVNVFDGMSLEVRKGMSVLVEGNMISAVESGTMKAPDGATVIDGGGRTLMPGLIDNHVHLFMSATSQMKLLDPVESYERLESYAKKETTNVLMRGFTSVRDMGGPVFGLKAAIDKGEIRARVSTPAGQ